MKKATYDDIAWYYDRYLQLYFEVKEMSKFILNLFSSLKISKTEKIMDIGCGSGKVLRLLSRYQYKNLYGIDISKKMIELARLKLKDKDVKLKNLDFFELKTRKYFDAVICTMDVVNHIERIMIEDFFKKVSTILRHKGFFLFDINTFDYLKRLGSKKILKKEDDTLFYWNIKQKRDKTVIRFTIKKGNEQMTGNINQYKYKECFIESLLESNGFAIIEKLYDYKSKSKSRFSSKVCYVCQKVK